MENKFKDFFDEEIITISKSDAIKRLARRFKVDNLEAQKIYNEWRRNWCDVTQKESYFLLTLFILFQVWKEYLIWKVTNLIFL